MGSPDAARAAISVPSDEAVLAGMGSGDGAAAAEFVRRYERRVYGLTHSILRDRGAAEEAAQETFVRAWRHAAGFDPRRGSVAAWLLTIARNTSINMLPSRRAAPVDPDVLLGLSGDRLNGGAHRDVAFEDAEPLREAVRRLPEGQRRALVLAVFYGFTAREMSELDEVPIGTVKTRIRSALMKLRSEMGVGDGS
jgi:RNA polymerase sigma factor (sigma-70 family)